MAGIKRFDHIGITVADLELVTGFFTQLGLEIDGRLEGMEGEFLDTVCGLHQARTSIVMLRAPGSDVGIELSSFQRPDPAPGNPHALANELGLRSVAFEVDDLEALVQRLGEEGYGLDGGIGRYADQWLMAYVRGPEGLIVALAERLG